MASSSRSRMRNEASLSRDNYVAGPTQRNRPRDVGLARCVPPLGWAGLL